MGDDGAGGDAAEAHCGQEAASVGEGDSGGEQYGCRDVGDVDDNVGCHRADAVLHSYEPAFECHQAKSRRGSPDAYEEVFACQFFYLGGAAYAEQGEPEEKRMQQQEQQ